MPLREPDMEPFEIMVSESQERMLCVVEPERVGEVLGVCERWEMLATPIGVVTEGDRFQVLHRGALVADLPVSVLVDDCPLYDLEPAPPPAALYAAPAPVLSGERVAGRDAAGAAAARPTSPRGGPVFEQYDPIVQSRTVRRPEEADAAVLVLPDGVGDRGLDRRQRPPGGLRSPRAAPPRPCTSAPPTSPASAPSRSGSRTA